MSYFNPNLPDIVARSLFMNYDTNNNGMLENNELKRLFVDDLSLKPGEAETYVLLLDTDGDGVVSYNEFVSWLRSGENLQLIGDSSRYTRVRKAVDLFKEYDTDGNQSLDRQEFQRAFLKAGGRPSLVNEAFVQLDADGNGVISFREFLRWLSRIPMNSFDD